MERRGSSQCSEALASVPLPLVLAVVSWPIEHTFIEHTFEALQSFHGSLVGNYLKVEGTKAIAAVLKDTQVISLGCVIRPPL